MGLLECRRRTVWLRIKLGGQSEETVTAVGGESCRNGIFPDKQATAIIGPSCNFSNSGGLWQCVALGRGDAHSDTESSKALVLSPRSLNESHQCCRRGSGLQVG